MPTINRCAIVLKARQALVDWVNKADPAEEADEITLKDAQHEPTVYLIPDCGNDEEAALWIKGSYEEFFERELLAWYTDRTLWPANRTYEMFCRWFDFSVHSIVEDLAEMPIIHDEDDDDPN
jgi:hypothetical protein